MHNSYRILISVLAIVFSLAATCIGFALVGNLSIFSAEVGCYLIFIMQFIATVWCVIFLGRTKKE